MLFLVLLHSVKNTSFSGLLTMYAQHICHNKYQIKCLWLAIYLAKIKIVSDVIFCTVH